MSDSLFLRFCASTTSLHVSRSAWRVLLAIELALFLSALFGCLIITKYHERLPSGQDVWRTDVWEDEEWQESSDIKTSGCAPEPSGFCENCNNDWMIRSPINSFSNVSFVMAGFVVLIFGIEDYRYFKKRPTAFPYASPPPPHALQDYTCLTSPNMLVYCGWSSPHFSLTVLNSSVLIYTGIGSFLMHACSCGYGYMLDLCACYTVATFLIPYHFFNFLQSAFVCAAPPDNLASRAKLCAMILTVLGVLTSVLLPYWYWHYDGRGWSGEALLSIPLCAGLNVFGYVVHLFVNRQHVKIRERSDNWWAAFGAFTGGISYAIQTRDPSTLCFSPTSPFQAHALWHCGMATAILAFYFFMRQERRRTPIESEPAEVHVQLMKVIVIEKENFL